MPVEGLGGLLGSGKTLGMVLFTYIDYLEEDVKVYSNFKTSFSEMVNPLDLIDFELNDCVLMLDELGSLFDSRNTNSRMNILLSYFFMQSRKKKVKIRYTSQLLGLVDKRGRDITDYRILCRALPNTQNPERFSYTLFVGAHRLGAVTLSYEKAKEELFNLYDTEEVIIPLMMDRESLNKEQIMLDFKASPTKKSFSQLTKVTYPQLPIDAITSCYDFLKRNDEERAFRVLTY